MENTELQQFIERIEHLEEQKRDLSADIRGVYSELKSQGYDVKAVREIIKLRKMTQADRAEFEYLTSEYKTQLGIE